MNHFLTFLLFCSYIFQLFVKQWIFVVFLSLNIFASFLITTPFKKRNTQVFYYLVFIPLVFPTLILSFGVIWGHADTNSEPNVLLTYLLYALFGLHIFFTAFFIRIATGMRWFIFSLSLLQIWLSLATLIVSLMAVNGSWV